MVKHPVCKDILHKKGIPMISLRSMYIENLLSCVQIQVCTVANVFLHDTTIIDQTSQKDIIYLYYYTYVMYTTSI